MQANDTYFLESGDKIRYFFETDAFDASGKLQYKKVEFVKEWVANCKKSLHLQILPIYLDIK